ncbi:hypothetical protein V6N13_091121 [Hibiscus sabdariffa]
MQHGLERDYEVMDDNDIDGINLVGDMSEHNMLDRTKVVDVVDDGVDPQDFFHVRQPHVVFLQEAQISGAVADSTVSKFGFPNARFRKLIWDPLAALDQGDVGPWLIEVDYVGVDLTWRGGSLYQKLNYCLMNDAWSRPFLASRVFHLDRVGSDQCPLLLRTRLDPSGGVDCPFRYQWDVACYSSPLECGCLTELVTVVFVVFVCGNYVREWSWFAHGLCMAFMVGLVGNMDS